MAMPPSLTKSWALSSRALPTPDHDQARHVEARRRHDFQRRSALALEPVGGGGALHQIAGRRQRLAGRRPEFQPLLAEHDENALGGSGQRGEFKLEDGGHRESSAKETS